MPEFEQNALSNLLYFNNVDGQDVHVEILDIESFISIMDSDDLQWYLSYMDIGFFNMFEKYVMKINNHPIFKVYFDHIIDNYPDYTQFGTGEYTFLMDIVHYKDNIGDNFMHYFHKIISKMPEEYIYHKNESGENILNIACTVLEYDVIMFLLENYSFDIVTNNSDDASKYHFSLLSSLSNSLSNHEHRIEIMRRFILEGCPVSFEGTYFYDNFSRYLYNMYENNSDEHYLHNLNVILQILDMLIEIDFFKTHDDNFIDTVFGKLPDKNYMNITHDRLDMYIDYFIGNGYKFSKTFTIISDYDIVLFNKVVLNTDSKEINMYLPKFFSLLNGENINHLETVLSKVDISTIGYDFFKDIFCSIYRNNLITFEMKKMVIDLCLDNDSIISSDDFSSGFFNRCDIDSLSYFINNLKVPLNIKFYQYVNCNLDLELIKDCFKKTSKFCYHTISTFIERTSERYKKDIFVELYNYTDLFNNSIDLYLRDGIEYLNEDNIIDLIDKYKFKDIIRIYLYCIKHEKVKIIKFVRDKFRFICKINLSPFKQFDYIKVTNKNVLYLKEIINNTKSNINKSLSGNHDNIKKLVIDVRRYVRMKHVIHRRITRYGLI
jgi:hypothetical protein